MTETENTRKRSKRHRRHRNNISRREAVESMKSFAIYAQDVLARYNRKFKKKLVSVAPPIEKFYTNGR